ncbi:MAG: type I methionyl aminopeptidase [bacterium]|nr:type I methionyl aminopeptidase [bacterium]
MISVKNSSSIRKMHKAGQLLFDIFEKLSHQIRPGVTTLELDSWIAQQLKDKKLISKTKGYRGYQHVSCISINDEVVHGVPKKTNTLKNGDLVKVDICASWQDYCADAARTFLVGEDVSDKKKQLAAVAQQALDKGIEQARQGNHLTDISAAIQQEVERHGFSVIRDFAGHGIGKQMHEEPEILNYGQAGQGPVLRAGMTLALEPMITMGRYDVYIAEDGWTVKTIDNSVAAHVEDTIVVTESGPKILTRGDLPTLNRDNVI